MNQRCAARLGLRVRPRRYRRSVRTAAALVVDPRTHREEVDRFRSFIVAGPGDSDCDIWVGAIGGDGYGRFRIVRSGCVFSVRPNRYALALTSGGFLPAGVLALHECDNPICVRVGERHLAAGTQSDNISRMARMGRGGGGLGRPRHGDLRDARRARSVALRAAVRDGWDPQAVESALIGDHPTLW